MRKNKIILVIWGSLILLTTIPIKADPIVVGDNEWRQVTDTLMFSYNDIATVCDAYTGVCGENLLGGVVDLSGWIWASVEEVGALFEQFSPHPGGIYYYTEVDSPWAPAVFDLFVPTFSSDDVVYVEGLSRTAKVLGDSGYSPSLANYLSEGSTDHADTSSGLLSDNRYFDVGGWFFRPIHVLEPSTLALFGIGLAGMGLARSRKHS